MKNNQKICPGSIIILSCYQRCRGCHVHSTPYSSGWSLRGGRRPNRNNGQSSSPAVNPPTCAHHAMPPTWLGLANANVPLNNCSKNHIAKYNIAGSSKKNGTNSTGNITTSRAVGNSNKYAPNTPAIAPEAPTVGTVASGWVRICVVAATIPQIR